MNKIIVAVVLSLFAVSSFAVDAKKDEKAVATKADTKKEVKKVEPKVEAKKAEAKK